MTTKEVLEKIEQATRERDERARRFHVNMYLGAKDRVVALIQDISGCDADIAEQVYMIKVEENQKKNEAYLARKAEEKKYIPKCPTCGSPDVKKITGGKRWLTTGLFGLGSSNVGKTMECNNCGYKW